ncbi:MAG: hypothetical protein M5U19_10465 [Microthrixaceae bacterium]|nr:hypothetical protein [Microthrixaceae bacterium]
MDGFTQRYVYDTAGDVERIRTRQYAADRFVGANGTDPDPVKWDLTGNAAPTIQDNAASFTVTDTSGSKGRMNSLASLSSGYDTTYTLDLGDRTKATTVKAYNRYVTADSWDLLEFESDSTTATLKRKSVVVGCSAWHHRRPRHRQGAGTDPVVSTMVPFESLGGR